MLKNLLLTILLITISHLNAESKMNILVLTVDDMNCDSIGVYGCTTPNTTPNIDQFANQVFKFNHAHVHATSCIPSRNVVQTGRYLYNSGIEGFYQLPKEEVTYQTIPDIFQENGYLTMIRGKASHTSPYHPYPAWDINFDDVLKEERVNIRSTQSFYDYTKRGIEAAKEKGKPFYYSINLYDPHTALYSFSHKRGVVSTELNGADRNNPPSRIFKPEEITMPKFLPDTELSRKEVTAYYNSVRRADDSFGNVIKALKDTGVYDNTLIIFFSDHGMPFAFAKTAMYYHSTHTPLLVHWPGKTSIGTVDDSHLIGTVDILPTLLDIIGIEQPEGLDGRSFVPILQGYQQSERDFVYVMYEENVGGSRQPMRTVTSTEFTYICNLWSDGERQFATATKGMAATWEMKRLAEEGDPYMQKRWELFNHSTLEQFFNVKTDPDCLNNLIDEPTHRQQVKNYQNKMVELMKASNDPMLEVYQKRYDKAAVAKYLAQLDAASKDRKSNKKIYSRSYSRKNPEPQKVTKSVPSEKTPKSPATNGQTLEEFLAKAKKRAENKDKEFDKERSTRWFQKKDTNNDGIMDEVEKNAKVSKDN